MRFNASRGSRVVLCRSTDYDPRRTIEADSAGRGIFALLSAEVVVGGRDERVVGKDRLRLVADGGGAQVESGSTEHLGNLLLSQGRAESLQSLDEMADQLGKLVDRLEGLHQGLGSFLINPPDLGADGFRCHQEDLDSLLQGPTSGGTKFQDCHSLRGWVVRSPPGIDLCHADVFDANLLTKLSHFLGQTVVLGLQPDPLVGAVGGPAPTVGQGVLCEGDYMENGGFDVGAPVVGEWDLRGFSLAAHLDLEGIVLSSAPFKIGITSMDSEGYDTWQDNPNIPGLPQGVGLRASRNCAWWLPAHVLCPIGHLLGMPWSDGVKDRPW